jgi:hypothetical protein
VSELDGKSIRELSEFKKTIDDMIVTNKVSNRRSGIIYDHDKVTEIIEGGAFSQLRVMSREFFRTNGLYRRMILYFATMSTYDTLLVPKFYDKPSTTGFLQNYNNALYYLDKMNIASEFSRIFTNVLVDGIYYGLVVNEQSNFTFYDLPLEYCRTQFKNSTGLNVLEFDMRYFDKIRNGQTLAKSLAGFPRSVQNYYKQYTANRNILSNWMVIQNDEGVAFYYKDLSPFFVSMIPALVDLKDYKGMEKKRDEQELSKILIQQLPLDENNELVFDLAEAKEIHRGIVQMLQNSPSVDVLTTFCEAKIESLQDGRQTVRDNLEKVERSVYNEAGVSKNLFATDSSTALDASIKGDFAIVCDVLEGFSIWINSYVSKKFSVKNEYFFEVNILPISHYNREDVLDKYLTAAQNGFSKILVGIASGIKQSNLMNILTLENDILGLPDVMKPLQTSNTLSAAESTGTGNTKKLKDKTAKTVKNIESTK